MLLSDFDYSLPKELIANHPPEPRDSARLLVLNRGKGLEHSHFYNLPDFLAEGDFLVFNQSRVIPARLFGKVEDREVEILLVKQTGNLWEAKAKPAKKLQADSKVLISETLSAEIQGKDEGVIKLRFNLEGDDFWKEVERIGEMPLPPYILKTRHEKHEEEADKEDYQTVYAKDRGSAAAPTAGLHFTEELLQKIQDKGCDIGFLTLHVGLGTFEPIRTENIEDHKIHSEHFELSDELAYKINKAKKEGRRIIAVGTTTVRVLETCTENGLVKGKSGETDIYIYPGYRFKCVDALITNFHLPKSSLLLLVSAFSSREKILAAYREAIDEKYRFFSYGDGMFIT